MKPCYHPPYTMTSTNVMEEILDAFDRYKKNTHFLEFDGQKASFRQARPHQILSFGIAYEDHQTGTHRVITSEHTNVPRFVLLFRSKNSGDSFAFMTAEHIEISSASEVNFAAYIWVQFKELDKACLYTISKVGEQSVCLNCTADPELLPLHFCTSLFGMMGGMIHGQA